MPTWHDAHNLIFGCHVVLFLLYSCYGTLRPYDAVPTSTHNCIAQTVIRSSCDSGRTPHCTACAFFPVLPMGEENRFSWSLTRAERIQVVELVMAFLPDESVITITADSVNALGLRDSYRLVQRLTLRQQMVLLPTLAESILDTFPDLDDLDAQPRAVHEHMHLSHVAHFLPPVLQSRCHVSCGCWRDIGARRALARRQRQLQEAAADASSQR